MNYQQIKLTKQGKELIQKTIKEGSSIEFSEMRLSSQAYGQDELEDLTDLDNIQQTATLSQAKRLADSNIQLSAVFSNEEVSNGFTVNTIGVYVTNPDQVEETILYGVTSTDEHPFYMAPHSVNPVNMILNLTVGIGEAENFSVNVNPAGVASQEDLDSVKDSVKQLAESEAEFGPRLTELVQNDEKLTAQLAQTNQQFSQAVGAVTEDSEVVMARGDKDILGERLDEFEVNLDVSNKLYSKNLTRDDLINGWKVTQGGLRLMRQGNFVLFTSSAIIGLNGEEATSSPFIDLPLGFRVSGLGNYGTVGNFWLSGQQVRIGKDFNRLTAPAGSGVLDGFLMWMTKDPYPEN